MGMEMELKQGEIQAHCTDLLDGTLALVRSALQSMIRNGGRKGISLSAGFRWALGK